MTAPTEAEIRAIVEVECDETGRLNLAGRLSDGFSTSVLGNLYDVDDLRESEQRALELAVAAGLRFATEHPDAPRAKAEPVPA